MYRKNKEIKCPWESVTSSQVGKENQNKTLYIKDVLGEDETIDKWLPLFMTLKRRVSRIFFGMNNSSDIGKET